MDGDNFVKFIERLESNPLKFYVDEHYKIYELPPKGRCDAYENGRFAGAFYRTNKDEVRPYEEDYDILKNYKGVVYKDIYGARHLKPVCGRNYEYLDGKLVGMFIADKAIDMNALCYG